MIGLMHVGTIVRPGIIAIEASAVVTVGVTRIIVVEVAIITVKASHPIAVRMLGVVAIGSAAVVMIGLLRRLVLILVAIGIHIVPELAHRAAEVLLVGGAAGLHLMENLAEAHARLPHRRDLVAAHRDTVMPPDLRGGECAGDRLLTRWQSGVCPRRVRTHGGIPVAARFTLSPCGRYQQQAAKCPIDDCTAHRSLLRISHVRLTGDRAHRRLRR